MAAGMGRVGGIRDMAAGAVTQPQPALSSRWWQRGRGAALLREEGGIGAVVQQNGTCGLCRHREGALAQAAQPSDAERSRGRQLVVVITYLRRDWFCLMNNGKRVMLPDKLVHIRCTNTTPESALCT